MHNLVHFVQSKKCERSVTSDCHFTKRSSMGAFHALKIVQMVPNVQILQQRQQTLPAAIQLLTEALNNV